MPSNFEPTSHGPSRPSAPFLSARFRREVFFSVRFSSTEGEVEGGLRPGGRVGDAPADLLIQEAREAIEYRLPTELSELFGLSVRTRFIAVREGSIEIYFAAVFAGLGILSRYKNLVESIDLLKRHLLRLLQAILSRRHVEDDVDVAVNVEYPRFEHPHDRPWPSPWHRLMHHPEGEMMAWLLSRGFTVGPRRDGFFWFLLVLCVLEGAALALLVWRAVLRTYFP